MTAELGRIRPPYPVERCAATDCGRSTLNEDDGAYLHRDLDSQKLVVLCGPCSRLAELVAAHSLPLVAL